MMVSWSAECEASTLPISRQDPLGPGFGLVTFCASDGIAQKTASAASRDNVVITALLRAASYGGNRLVTVVLPPDVAVLGSPVSCDGSLSFSPFLPCSLHGPQPF
jgi:hypothetical protein